MRCYFLIGALILGACVSAHAQWLNQPMAGAPRTADGKVNMTGPVPRVNGKPDLSGLWQVEAEPRGPGLFGLGESPNSRYFRDILSDFKPGEEPLTDAGRELFNRHVQAGAYANPSLNCLPTRALRRICCRSRSRSFNARDRDAYEVETIFRQVFTDGRKATVDPAPTWLGYSVGKWDGDTLVVDTRGFNDRSWLDARGHGHSEEMRVEERFHRRDFGHLDLTITMEDPKIFTRPLTFSVTERLLPDTDVFEHICAEAEKDAARIANAPK